MPATARDFRFIALLGTALVIAALAVAAYPAAGAIHRVETRFRAGGAPVQKKAFNPHRDPRHSSATTSERSTSHPTGDRTGRKKKGGGSPSSGGGSSTPSTPPAPTGSTPTPPAPTESTPTPTEPAPTPTETTPAPTPPTTPVESTPPPTETTTKPSTCPLGAVDTEGAIPMTMPGCRVISSDTSALTNPASLWGYLQCVNASHYAWNTTAGDPHPMASGAGQGNESFRQMTTFDGDEFWGERCELGEDDWRTSPSAYYREGDHYVTYISERLPSNFPLATKTWQTVMQMKQAQPSDGGGGGPIIEMEARENRWVIDDNWVELFSFPARANQWTRFAWDVYYSRDPAKGRLQVSADLNGDGDFEDPGERSPVFHVATLKTEIEGPNGASDGIRAGEAIPSHLRAGIYHNPEISCPVSTGGCSVQVDNMQVMAPAS